MAKVTIVIEDVAPENEDEAGVNITFGTEPELKEGDETLLSHALAMQFHNLIEEIKSNKEEKETEDGN